MKKSSFLDGVRAVCALGASLRVPEQDGPGDGRHRSEPLQLPFDDEDQAQPKQQAPGFGLIPCSSTDPYLLSQTI